uniref:THAP-type domain-containing protein n=1 Tax=Amphimedon queenslandica TaxID=400682 RepID=A0A1X7VK94_AMPQE
MGKRCTAASCSNTHKDGVSLFTFPTDVALKIKWTAAVRRTRDKWSGPTKYSCICSIHFTDYCFEPLSDAAG